MKVEDIDLLSKDLCGRLPYGVKCVAISDGYIGCISSIEFQCGVVTFDDGRQEEVVDIKPYLFPLSSMTEEQKKDFKEISKCEYEIRDYGGFDSEGVYLIEIGKCEYEYNIDTTVEEFYFNYEIIDWLNKNQFDYRDLIAKGLAIDATGLNIYKEETK